MDKQRGDSIYGKFEDVPIEDLRRLFETNFWGVVYGSLIASSHFKDPWRSFINVGSTYRIVRYHFKGFTRASKHAVKGFTDAYRMELEAEDAPVSVTLSNRPRSTHHTRNTHEIISNRAAKSAAGLCSLILVAETILYCAENPVRDVFVGAAAKAHSLAEKFAPRTLTKSWNRRCSAKLVRESLLMPHPLEGLYETHDDRLKERGDYRWPVLENSLYTKASLHPAVTSAVAAGAALAIGGLAYRLFRRSDNLNSNPISVVQFDFNVNDHRLELLV